MLTVLGSTYQALQQWEEAHNTLTEAITMAAKLDFKLYSVPIVSRLCMHSCITGAWEEAYTYALQAIALRKRFGKTLIQLDFSRPYEMEALLHAGNEQQVRAEILHMEHCLGSNQRFRIPYLRSLAALNTWEGSVILDLGDHLLDRVWLALPGEVDADGVFLVVHAHPQPIRCHPANLAHQQDWSHPVCEGAHGFYGPHGMPTWEEVL